MSKLFTVIVIAMSLISMPAMAASKGSHKPKSSMTKSHSSPKATHAKSSHSKSAK